MTASPLNAHHLLATMAQICDAALTRADRVREDLLEIAAATKGDPAVQHLVGQALDTLDEAHRILQLE